jgi:small subunit ribosomal protein S8
MVNDAVADFLARLRNATLLHKESLELPYTKMVYHLAQVLKEEGFLVGVKKFRQGRREGLRIDLSAVGEAPRPFPVFRRLSRPGRRIYRTAAQLRRFYKGNSLVIVSTSRGLMTVGQARNLSLGGELVCELR